MPRTDQANSLNILLSLFDLVGDGVGELTAFLRGRNDRSVQEGIVFIVIGGSDVPLSAHAADAAVLARVSLTVAAGMGTSWIGDWWTAEENDSSLAHRARRRTSFSRVFEDCGLRILSLRCHRGPVSRESRSLSAGKSPCALASSGGRPRRLSARPEMMSPAFAPLCVANSRQPRRMRPMNRASARDR